MRCGTGHVVYTMLPIISDIAIKNGSRIRLIALTSRGDPEDRDRSTAAGFDVHLVKPVSQCTVEGTIRAVLAA